MKACKLFVEVHCHGAGRQISYAKEYSDIRMNENIDDEDPLELLEKVLRKPTSARLSSKNSSLC